MGGATRDSCLRETFQTISIAEHAIIRFDLIAVIVVVFFAHCLDFLRIGFHVDNIDKDNLYLYLF